MTIYGTCQSCGAERVAIFLSDELNINLCTDCNNGVNNNRSRNILTGKYAQLAILMRKVGILSSNKVTCKYCDKKVKHSLLFKHYREVHQVNTFW